MHRVKTRLRWPITGPSGPPPVYATWNPADKGASITLSNGNLTADNSGSGGSVVRSTIGKSSGKWYWEVTQTAVSSNITGVANLSAPVSAPDSYLGADANGYGYYFAGSSTSKVTNAIFSAYGAAYTTGDVVGVALDMDAGEVTFYKNGVSQGVAFSGLTGTIYAAVGAFTGCVYTANFGATPLAFPLAGYNAGLYS